MPIIKLSMEEHQHLTKLVARSYDNNYRNDVFTIDTLYSTPLQFHLIFFSLLKISKQISHKQSVFGNVSRQS